MYHALRLTQIRVQRPYILTHYCRLCHRMAYEVAERRHNPNPNPNPSQCHRMTYEGAEKRHNPAYERPGMPDRARTPD